MGSVVGGVSRSLNLLYFIMDVKDTSSTSLPCGEQKIVQTFNFSRYFIIKRTDCTSNDSFKITSPFLIAKTFQCALNKEVKIR